MIRVSVWGEKKVGSKAKSAAKAMELDGNLRSELMGLC